jgi:hypothetical protein
MDEQGLKYLSWDIISSCVTSDHFWWFEIPKHSFYFAVFFVMQVFWFSMFWAWIFVLLQVSNLLCLDVMYHSGYFYIMCCECGDSDGYRCRQNKSIHSHPILSHFLSTAIGSLNHNQAQMEIIFNIMWVFSPKVWIDHTQCQRKFMIWTFDLQFMENSCKNFIP